MSLYWRFYHLSSNIKMNICFFDSINPVCGKWTFCSSEICTCWFLIFTMYRRNDCLFNKTIHLYNKLLCIFWKQPNPKLDFLKAIQWILGDLVMVAVAFMFMANLNFHTHTHSCKGLQSGIWLYAQGNRAHPIISFWKSCASYFW